MDLNPDARKLLDILARAEHPFHTLTPTLQREASRKMHKVFGTPARDDVMVQPLIVPAAGQGIGVRCYRPRNMPPEVALPACIYFHGGGWTVGDLNTYDGFCRQLCAESGCAVLSVDYRLAPEHPFPAAVEDAWTSVAWISGHAAELGIAANRLAVGGDSAGGNLATVVALLARDAGGPSLRFQMLVYPATDQTRSRPSVERFAMGYLLDKPSIDGFEKNYVPEQALRADWRASPLLAPAHTGLPPALIVTAGFDPLTDSCVDYVERLRACEVAVEHLHYPDLIHGFLTLGGIIAKTQEVVQTMAAKLARALAVEAG